MALRLAVLKNVFDAYNTKAYSLVFLFIAMIYFILKDKKEQRNLLIYEFFGILLLVTPFIGNKIVTLGAGTGSNWPVYGGLCAIPVTAYMAVDILKKITGKKERYLFYLLFFIVIQLGLGIGLTGEQFGLPANLQKTSKLTMAVAEQLDEHAEWYVMAPKCITGELREYDRTIRVVYEDDYEEWKNDLILLQKKAVDYGCNCVIVEKKYDEEDTMLAGGWEKLAEVEELYSIYKEKEDL